MKADTVIEPARPPARGALSMPHATPRILCLGLLAVGILLPLAPTAHAQQDIPLCLDPQFRIGPQVNVNVPAGTYWTPSGELHEYGRTNHYGVWADNRAGVATVCFQLEGTSAFDYCLNCLAVA